MLDKEWLLMVHEVHTNLRVLKPSRRKPRVGDVFAMRLPDEAYLFGRVVSTDARWTLAVGAGRAVLIYVFRDRTLSLELADRSVLRVDRLLVPPVMTNLLPWSRGYFQTVGNMPLGPGEVLLKHCFLDGARGRYYDEYGNELPRSVEPVGDYGLHSYRTIDDLVSEALRIPPVPGN
jgi:hypothetical protein